MDIKITKTAIKSMKRLDVTTRNRIVPSVAPMQDEIEALAQEKIDIANGDYMNLADVDWDAV